MGNNMVYKRYRVWFTDGSAVCVDALDEIGAKIHAMALSIKHGNISETIEYAECLSPEGKGK